MHDLRMFDSKWLKVVGFVRRHLYILASVLLLIWAVFIWASATVLAIPGMWLGLAVFVAIWYYANKYSLQNLFMSANKLSYYFENERNIWKLVGPQYRSMKKSAFMKPGNYGLYGSRLTMLPLPNQNSIPLAFVKDSGCVGWIELKRSFPHLVVDSLRDGHTLRKLFNANTLPPEQLRLEGNFPESFKVYQEPNQQIVTLQIMSPDRMAFLAYDIKEINLEIQDNYLRLYAANAQKNSREFEQFLQALNMMQEGLKTARISNIK